jgi:hypothetical protein
MKALINNVFANNEYIVFLLDIYSNIIAFIIQNERE